MYKNGKMKQIEALILTFALSVGTAMGVTFPAKGYAPPGCYYDSQNNLVAESNSAAQSLMSGSGTSVDPYTSDASQEPVAVTLTPTTGDAVTLSFYVVPQNDPYQEGDYFKVNDHTGRLQTSVDIGGVTYHAPEGKLLLATEDGGLMNAITGEAITSLDGFDSALGGSNPFLILDIFVPIETDVLLLLFAVMSALAYGVYIRRRRRVQSVSSTKERP